MFEKICIGIFGVISIVFVTMYCFCRVELQCVRSGLDKIIANYATVADIQQSIIAGLGELSDKLTGVANKISDISNGIGTVKDSITTVSNRISDAQRAVDASQQLIDEQQQLLARIQKEGQSGNS